MSATLIGAAATVIVGLLGLLGTRWLSNVQRRTADNEERLSRYENWDHLIDNYRQDYDRVRAERDRVRHQRDEAWAQVDRLSQENSQLQRQLERWLQRKEPNA